MTRVTTPRSLAVFMQRMWPAALAGKLLGSLLAARSIGLDTAPPVPTQAYGPERRRDARRALDGRAVAADREASAPDPAEIPRGRPDGTR